MMALGGGRMWMALAGVAWVAAAGTAGGLVLALWRHRAFRPRRPERPEPLGPYAYACLCGGRRRVAQTALAALHHDGRIAVKGRGSIVRADPAEPSGSGALRGGSAEGERVEAAALAVCRRGRGVPALKAETRIRRSRAVRGVAEALAQEGLLPHPVLVDRIRAWTRAVGGALLLTSGIALAALFVRARDGDGRAGLAGLLALAAFLFLFALLCVLPEPRRGPTGAGRRAAGARAPSPGPLIEVAEAGWASAGMPYELRSALWRPSRGSFVPDDPPGLGGL
ncbi:TIGR04222 domain-containing membrane protein [Streptomyces sp. NPDC004436]